MYLVTGGAGFLGQHRLARLRTNGESVRSVDDMSTSPWAELIEPIDFTCVLDLTVDSCVRWQQAGLLLAGTSQRGVS